MGRKVIPMGLSGWSPGEILARGLVGAVNSSKEFDKADKAIKRANRLKEVDKAIKRANRLKDKEEFEAEVARPVMLNGEPIKINKGGYENA